MGRAEQSCADRIGPEHARAVDRPEPDGQRRGRVHGQPGIAHASQLEIRTRHPTGFASHLCASGCQNDSLKKGLVSPAAAGRSTAPAYGARPKAAITLMRRGPKDVDTWHPHPSDAASGSTYAAQPIRAAVVSRTTRVLRGHPIT